MPFSKKRKPLGSLKELERWFVVAFRNSWRPFLGKGIAEEILDLLPMNFNGEHSADEGCDQDLKNIAASAGVQVGKSIL